MSKYAELLTAVEDLFLNDIVFHNYELTCIVDNMFNIVWPLYRREIG